MMTYSEARKDPRYNAIPEGVLSELYNYVQTRRPTGDFLYAVLTNDLLSAFAHADQDSVAGMPGLIRFIYWEVEPGYCWGSPEKVKAWLSQKPKT